MNMNEAIPDLNFFTVVDWIALYWFILCWIGYTSFANYRLNRSTNLAQSLTELRGLWMKSMIQRDMRIPDTTSLGILQRTVTFFASTTIFILAGLLAVLGASDKAVKLAQAIPFVAEHSQSAWEMKVLFMVFIFIYAFFKFSWSVRQYNFALVMFGAAPEQNSTDTDDYVLCSNELLTSANKSFNYGLRAYTFSMAAITWFVHPILFIATTAWVVGVLYRREFYSRTLAAMQSAIRILKKQD
ncbi:DUF599 domain-containing protein [Aliikangiella maris]|uniref:DUF599 domain-containing protein n=2 Tax=Aliikangiella maris TaxID=3162458 RepID=A0ABV3MJ57_9GAMM